MEQSDTVTEATSKLIEVQKNLPKLTKDADNPFTKSKYISLGTLLSQVLPVLNRYGFALTQQVTTLDGQPALKTTLLHTTGAQIDSTMLLMLKTADPQGQGSAITYARRYSLMSLLGIVADDDDDGQSAQRSATQAKVAPQQLKQIHELLELAGVEKENEMTCLQTVMGDDQLNVREISYLEAEKLIKDLKVANPETLVAMSVGDPF